MAETLGVTFAPTDTPDELAAKLNRIIQWLAKEPKFGAARFGDEARIENSGKATFVSLKVTNGAATGKVLFSDDDGDLSYGDVVTAPAGSDKDVQFNDGGAFGADSDLQWDKTAKQLTVGGTVDADKFTATGTLWTLVDLSRSIGGNLSASGLVATDSLSGIVTSDGTAAVHGKVDVAATVSAEHAGVFGEAAHTSGVPTGPLAGVSAKASTSGDSGHVSAVLAQVAYHGQSFASLPTKRAALEAVAVGSDASDEIWGCYSFGQNTANGHAYGYQGYGYNSYASGSGHNATGVFGFARSDNGLAAGLWGRPYYFGAKGFAAVLQGHVHHYYGNLYIYETQSLQEVPDKASIPATAKGCLWIENDLEVDGELFGGRVLLTAADSGTAVTTSGYLSTHDGVQMSATCGYPMARAGSVKDLALRCVVNSYSAGADVKIQLKENGTTIAEASDTLSGTGVTIISETFDRGDATFSSGNQLQFYVEITGTAEISEPVAVAGLQLDT